jgi:hypothetical protein
MLHDWKTFGDEISALLKTSGDSGDTGDKSEKRSRASTLSVSASSADVSPVQNEWRHDVAASGDNKNDENQPVKGGVSTVSSVSTNFAGGNERVSARQDGARSHAVSAGPRGTFESVPSAWVEVCTRLRSMEMPDAFTPVRWQHVMDDTETFLRQWGSAAAQLGWSARDLFGVHPAAPACRYDAMGLLIVLQGSVVVALTDTTATMRAPSGAILTFRRESNPTAILISEIRP